MALILFAGAVLASLAGAALLGFAGSFLQTGFKTPPTPSEILIGRVMLLAAVVVVPAPWGAMWAYTRHRAWGLATAVAFGLAAVAVLYVNGQS